MSPQVIQILSFVGGAAITAVAGYWTALQQRRQAQLTMLLDALQEDNKALRDENRQLRDELKARQRRETRNQ